MSIIRMIFNICASILRETVNLFGYEVSLMQVIIYGFCMYLIFVILREFFL